MHKNSVISRRLREARKRAGLNQIELAIQAGIDPSGASPRMSQYECSKHQPGLRMVERFAKCLSVPVPYFYADDDQLAAWILAFNEVPPALQREVLRHVPTSPLQEPID
jgi:transcriptional regulator with XRE-family HTH domain